jgi:hypothetical protein
VGILGLERAQTVILHRENASHSERSCIQETALDAFIQA